MEGLLPDQGLRNRSELGVRAGMRAVTGVGAVVQIGTGAGTGAGVGAGEGALPCVEIRVGPGAERGASKIRRAGGRVGARV